MVQGYQPHIVLQRALLLERQQGFQDRAAIGGLAPFARAQAERAEGQVRACLLRAAESLAGYESADRAVREAAIARALRLLLEGGDSEQPSPPRDVPAVPPPGDAPATRPPRAARRKEVLPPTAPRPRQHDIASPDVAATSAPLRIVHTPEDLDKPVTAIKGVGASLAEAFQRVDVHSVRDLLWYFPRAHYDYTDTSSISRMRLGHRQTLVGTIQDVRTNRTPRGITITTAAIADSTGTVAVRWFNQAYLANQLPTGSRIAVTGEPDIHGGSLVFVPRDFELIEQQDLTHAARLVPVYALTRGLHQRALRKLIRRVVEEYAGALMDVLSDAVRADLRLLPVGEAVRSFHFPVDEAARDAAQRRLAFDELLMVQLGLVIRKRRWQQPVPDVAVTVDPTLQQEYESALPFALTRAQQRVIAEILDDMARPVPMNRLLQGDVGSGKTAVAAAALLQIVQAGRQGVLMAPTEILAEQHARTVETLLAPFHVRCALLLGSTPRKQRRGILEAARSGDLDVVIGTHALIQEGVEFARLGLAVTDEQHRFGVEQRATLRYKGHHPHTLAMTATPIPRTLAMTIYGDLDVSAIDEMPPGRLPVITTWARTPVEAYGVVRDEIRQGHQAFVICPVIEESADSDMRSVVAEHKELQRLTFPDLQVGLLHGRMKPAEKERVLAAFRRGEYHILVATSVVEVGIDVPNATVMVIRDAHRFGLAQLHQFRGRVGRGGDQAFCVLLSAAEGEEARERLEALTATENGFELAEEDLRLRGPGEFWGTRQSGLPELRVAQLGDLATVELARRVAVDIVSADPDLIAPGNTPLREQMQRFWAAAADLS